MTTIINVKKKCAVCGNMSEHLEVMSSIALGPPDLDTRPPELMRSTIKMWIQTCPFCGYCAPDISEGSEKASQIVYSDVYKRQLHSPDFPKLANAFLCYSLIRESEGDFADAGWAAVHAAWACDDAGFNAGARKCRKKAVALLLKAREIGQEFAEEVGAEEAILVDLLRRSGQFELALKIAEEGLKKKPKKIIADILRFQKILISKSDVGCHTTAELPKEKG